MEDEKQKKQRERRERLEAWKRSKKAQENSKTTEETTKQENEVVYTSENGSNILEEQPSATPLTLVDGKQRGAEDGEIAILDTPKANEPEASNTTEKNAPQTHEGATSAIVAEIVGGDDAMNIDSGDEDSMAID